MSYLDVLLGGIKTIQNNGANVAAEPTLNIIGATSIVDDSANRRTNVTLGTGITQLSGDVAAGPGSGSIAATVVKANGATVPAAGALTTGNVLQVSGASALSYGPVNLAGGANYISGTLPAGNQAAQTLGGALSGTTAAAVIVPGTAGQIYVSNATPQAAWTSLIQYDTAHGRFTAGGSGSDCSASIGPLVSFPTSDAALYLLPNGVAATSGNPAMYADGTSLFINNLLGEASTRPVWISWAGNAGQFKFTSDGSGNNVLQTGTSAVSFSVGTNKAGATLILQADAATTIQTLSSAIGTELANLSQPAAGTGPRIYGSSGKLGIVDSSGGLTLLPGP